MDRDEIRVNLDMLIERPGALKMAAILSGSEIEALFEALPSPKYRTTAMTAYGSGLRVDGAMRLEVGDIDGRCVLIQLRDKGGKERYVLLPECCSSGTSGDIWA